MHAPLNTWPTCSHPGCTDSAQDATATYPVCEYHDREGDDMTTCKHCDMPIFVTYEGAVADDGEYVHAHCLPGYLPNPAQMSAAHIDIAMVENNAKLNAAYRDGDWTTYRELSHYAEALCIESGKRRCCQCGAPVEYATDLRMCPDCAVEYADAIA